MAKWEWQFMLLFKLKASRRFKCTSCRNTSIVAMLLLLLAPFSRCNRCDFIVSIAQATFFASAPVLRFCFVWNLVVCFVCANMPMCMASTIVESIKDSDNLKSYLYRFLCFKITHQTNKVWVCLTYSKHTLCLQSYCSVNQMSFSDSTGRLR